MKDDELPLETVNATLDVHETANRWMDLHEVGTSRAIIHDLIDQAVRDAHIFALAEAGRRVLTRQEIAGRLGLSEPTVRRRIAAASPPILPVKMVNNIPLYMVEDLPAIATAHIQGVVEEGLNTRYIAAKMRKAIAQVHHKTVIKRLSDTPSIKWPDVYGRPITLTLKVDAETKKTAEEQAKKDGWKDINHLILGFLVSYNEISRRWKEK